MCHLKLTVLGLAVISFTGCASGGDTADLAEYIAGIKSRPQGSIEPLPPVRTFDPFIYGATAMRSPFDEPVVVTGPEVRPVGDPNLKPDPLRVKDFLESFNLDSLKMTGTFEMGGTLWALVRDPNGGIHSVTVGNYLGKDHGKIISATATQLNLIEIVSDGSNAWVERPRTIKLSEKE